MTSPFTSSLPLYAVLDWNSVNFGKLDVGLAFDERFASSMRTGC